MRKISQLLWFPVLFAVLYTGWIFWQRHASSVAPAPKPERDPLSSYGSSVKILQFYTANGAVTRGEKALLCYGVLNATAVTLDPAVERVWPSLSRCFDVSPKETTRYTLKAEGADHQAVEESIEVVVKR